MSEKYVFSTAEGISLWLAYDRICVLCETPIGDLRFLTIDHVIPENLKDKPQEFDDVRKTYNLDATFEINEFANWVPAHMKCNQRKGPKVMNAPVVVTLLLARAARLAKKARLIYKRLTEQEELVSLVAKLDHQMQGKTPSFDEIAILRDLMTRAETAAPPEAQLIIDPEKWKIVVEKPWGLAMVSDGEQIAWTVLRWADSDLLERWKCNKCDSFGPWSDDHHDPVCLNCETRLVDSFRDADGP